MAENFYTILTSVGIAKFTNAPLTSQIIEFTQFALGDSNGAYYNPVASDTALKNEVWRGNIISVSVDDNNPNWLVIETVVPAVDGGFTVREVGLYDSVGDLLAIGKVPETYKPQMNDGSTKDLHFKVILEVSNTECVTLKIDPTVIVASREYVDKRINALYDEFFWGVDGGDHTFSNYDKVTLDGGDGNFSNLHITPFDAGRY